MGRWCDYHNCGDCSGYDNKAAMVKKGRGKGTHRCSDGSWSGSTLEKKGRDKSQAQSRNQSNYPLVQITRAKLQLVQARWTEAGGPGQLYGVWQVKNKPLEAMFRSSAQRLSDILGKASDMIDGWHGSAETNMLSIAQNGFDPSRRCGQAYGEGEYFAKDPNVSISYAKGGSFMFLCKLLLGEESKDHTWVDSCKYYVVKQRDGLCQALPVYLVQFGPAQGSALQRTLTQIVCHEREDEGTLRFKQRGGQTACEARRDAGMSAETTSHLWVGWLDPRLSRQNDDAIHDDVCEFLCGIEVAEVIPERNGARVGAFVRLSTPINCSTFHELAARRYHGRYRISVDDQQRDNPRCAGMVCPRLGGPSQYCRGWNINGHHAWHWSCPFEHPPEMRPTHRATYTLEEVAKRTAKYDEIETALLQSGSFHDGTPKLVGVHRVVNRALEAMYEKRRSFLEQKHGFALEKELWHGTNCKALPELLTHGLQPPADSIPSDACPVSGRKGLTTTLCGTNCPHCVEPHVWCKCHMYGHGIYMADLPQKSHRYVREPEMRVVKISRSTTAAWGVGARILGEDWSEWGVVVADEGNVWRLDSGRIAKKENESLRWWFDDAWEDSAGAGTARPVYSMLFCRVCLGSPFLIEGNLLSPSALHDVFWCQDPSDQLETMPEDWNTEKGHDCYYVRGLSGAQRAGLGVYNSEYVVFQPFQVLPLYRVDYILQ